MGANGACGSWARSSACCAGSDPARVPTVGAPVQEGVPLLIDGIPEVSRVGAAQRVTSAEVLAEIRRGAAAVAGIVAWGTVLALLAA